MFEKVKPLLKGAVIEPVKATRKPFGFRFAVVVVTYHPIRGGKVTMGKTVANCISKAKMTVQFYTNAQGFAGWKSV